ncbi:hypothetical protein [Limimaricola sp.]|uniref:hypothetical protein n=1 Tax=Limimaricola sp. TaxID=2211665 RepID=UPI0025C4F795|nr:hypothetical protein [Limimaricola sp.]
MAGLIASGVAAQQATTAPMSAIGWLSQSVETPSQPATPTEPPVSGSASTPPVTSQPLGQATVDGVGILPPSVTGLPATLWAASDAATLTDLIGAERVETLPALQDLIVTLMLAEADPPAGAGKGSPLFLARVDKLLDLGALEPAQSLIEAAKPDTPALFRRWFDIALLTRTEDTACKLLQSQPDILPTYAARVFCIARGGQWDVAALILNTGRALGDIPPEEEELLTRFLDPAYADGAPPLPPPSHVTPLIFRLREAIGEPLATGDLPRAFANADLADTTGWKGQIEAAERLARNGALSENVLQALYTARTPAASGGVWDRAQAVQTLDAAVTAGDAGAVAAALPAAWAAMQSVRCEVPFAKLYAEQVRAMPLTGQAAALAFRIALLSPSYEAAAQAYQPTTDEERFLAALARGSVTPTDVPAGWTEAARARAVAAAFSGAAPSPALAGLVTQGKLGEALLQAVATFNAGLAGDPVQVTDALALLRQVGLENVARKAALQYLLLDRAP